MDLRYESKAKALQRVVRLTRSLSICGFGFVTICHWTPMIKPLHDSSRHDPLPRKAQRSTLMNLPETRNPSILIWFRFIAAHVLNSLRRQEGQALKRPTYVVEHQTIRSSRWAGWIRNWALLVCVSFFNDPMVPNRTKAQYSCDHYRKRRIPFGQAQYTWNNAVDLGKVLRLESIEHAAIFAYPFPSLRQFSRVHWL